MTAQDIDKIEKVINGDTEPSTDWWVTTVRQLIQEVKRTREVINKLPMGTQDDITDMLAGE